MNEGTKSNGTTKSEPRAARGVPADRTRAARQPGGQLLGKQASSDAARRAAVVLEVLAGERTPQQGAQALAVSSNYYYLLERQALGGLLRACEPRPRGRARPSLDRKLRKLEAELARCQRECQRQAALVRATQRTVGIPAPPAAPAAAKRSSKKGPPHRRRRRAVARALAVAKTLRQSSTGQEGTAGIQTESLEAVRPAASLLNQAGSEKTRPGDGA